MCYVFDSFLNVIFFYTFCMSIAGGSLSTKNFIGNNSFNCCVYVKWVGLIYMQIYLSSYPSILSFMIAKYLHEAIMETFNRGQRVSLVDQIGFHALLYACVCTNCCVLVVTVALIFIQKAGVKCVELITLGGSWLLSMIMDERCCPQCENILHVKIEWEYI